jgi:tRNA threonylcarbamoyladenosine biosynthesis protein TsaB
MPLIINIDTTAETASVSLADNGTIVASRSNPEQKDHAAFLQPAIQQLVQEAGIALNKIDAIAVSAGPGSYTGLRVGMSSAKGLCFALNIPLITAYSLQVAAAAAKEAAGIQLPPSAIFCPMTDARRMEVFTALYDMALQPILAPQAMLLNENSFTEILNNGIVYFSGSGSAKWQTICSHTNARFLPAGNTVKALALFAYTLYMQQQFADIQTAVPAYIKDFHTTAILK